MNTVLKQLQLMVRSIGSSKRIEDYITYGDYMLLCTNRLIMHKKAEAGELSDEELVLVEELDTNFKQYLTPSQLKELTEMESSMPIQEWWGNT